MDHHKKSMWGQYEIFEGVIANIVNTSHLHSFYTFVRCEENVKLLYRVPGGDCIFKFHNIEGEDNVIDLASIGKQIGVVEMYLVQEFHIRFIDSKVGSSNVDIREAGVSNEDAFYVNITFEVSTTFEETNAPIELMEEEDDCGVEEDAQSDSTEDESLVDSDYDFKDDKDDVIFKKSVVGADKELEKAKEIVETIVVEGKNECKKKKNKKGRLLEEHLGNKIGMKKLVTSSYMMEKILKCMKNESQSILKS